MVIEGIVEQGNRIGTQLGYPTANIAIDDSADDGVWAAMVAVDGVRYGAMVSIGRRETITTDGKKVLEAHLLDFSGELYGKKIEVDLIKKIRPQKKFRNIEELSRAIRQDEIIIRSIFNS